MIPCLFGLAFVILASSSSFYSTTPWL